MFRPSLMFRPTWKAFVRRDYDFFVPHGRHDDHDVFRHDDGFRHLVLIPDFTQTSQDCTLSGSDPAGVWTQKHHLIWITCIFFSRRGENFQGGIKASPCPAVQHPERTVLKTQHSTPFLAFRCTVFRRLFAYIIQVEPGKPGAEVSKGKRTIRQRNQRSTLPIESFVTTLID